MGALRPLQYQNKRPETNSGAVIKVIVTLLYQEKNKVTKGNMLLKYVCLTEFIIIRFSFLFPEMKSYLLRVAAH